VALRIELPASFDRFDERFDELWAPLRGRPGLDRLFYTASEVGDFGMVWLAVAAVEAALGPASRTRTALRLAGALLFESALVNCASLARAASRAAIRAQR
jgi:hypothetical protein